MPVKPVTLITVSLGAAGAAKLVGLKPVRDNFERWGYPAPARIVVGAIEVGVAAAGLAAHRDPEARSVVAVGTLCAMAGAAATHARAGEAAYNYLPVALLTGAAIAVLAGR